MVAADRAAAAIFAGRSESRTSSRTSATSWSTSLVTANARRTGSSLPSSPASSPVMNAQLGMNTSADRTSVSSSRSKKVLRRGGVSRPEDSSTGQLWSKSAAGSVPARNARTSRR